MKKKFIYIIFNLILCAFYSNAQQNLQGIVKDIHQNPVKYATVWVASATQYHTETDSSGVFNLTLPENPEFPLRILISQVGYLTDTLIFSQQSLLDKVQIILKPVQLKEITVTEKQDPTLIGTLPIRNEVLTEKEFRRAACCNVSESFETNPSVDASFSDAVSGIRQINMLGLSGKYALATIENLSLIRGLNLFSGFTDIPATWVKSIHISKGTGSVLQGYESITGQINLNFQDPEFTEEKLYFNGYVNHLSRSEINANAKYTVHKKLSGMTLAHGSIMNKNIDLNTDSFMDMPMYQRITGMQRWVYIPNQNWEVRAGVRGVYEYRKSGQIHTESHHHNPMYEVDTYNRRMDYFVKAGRLFEKMGRSLGLLYSGIHHQQNANFGIYNYSGLQDMANFQAIYEEPIRKNHILKLSSQYRYEKNHEKNTFLSYNRIEHTFGIMAEHTWKIHEKHVILTGSRVDYHSLFGWIFTPRLHSKWTLSPTTTLRTVAGKGTRIPNIITENFASLASNRTWILQENLKPETGWNFGSIIDQKFTLFNRKGRFSTESFYTFFVQQTVEDYDASPQAIMFYNLKGKSYAFYTQTELEYELIKNFTAKLAYKYYDVKITLQDKLMDRPFVAKHRGLLTLSYLTNNEKWQFDATLQYHGRQRLPNTRSNPVAYQRPDYSPHYFILLTQAQFISKKHWDIYMGGENLLNVRQPNPIISADNPYSMYFDSTILYAPVVGRIIYAGIRWKW
jgi:outer membrane receptor for ferrienterochelin and colicin